MGVTKQAAQKRFVAKLPEPGAEPAARRPSTRSVLPVHHRAKRSVQAAQSQARDRRHHLVVPEHVALGVLHEPEGLSAKTVEALGVTREPARDD